MSDSKVHFYYHPFTRGRIIHWMLEEVGCDYEIHFLDFTKGANKTPEYLKINPMGKIPTITHKGTTVTESPAICAYLADAFPAAKLTPATTDPKRGTYYRWLFFAASCVEYAITDHRFPRKEEVPAGRLGYGTYAQTIDALESAVANGYITGEFSAADVYVASAIGWGLMQKDIEPRPAFLRYLELCQSRPAFKRFTEKAEALAPMPKQP